uniref:Uncharacterized protein n=1 Tax=Anguilla anguilla TaxID=7936 RepID=A0A0E9WF87_ANGAN
MCELPQKHQIHLCELPQNTRFTCVNSPKTPDSPV